MADNYAKNSAHAETTAFRNGTLQGAYLMLAARAIGLDVGYGDVTKVMPKLPRLDFKEACRLL